MLLLFSLILIYAGYIGSRLFHNHYKQKHLKSGDYCSVYVGENKLRGLILKVNHEVDVWVLNLIIRLARKDIYI
jgi:hypothetical protein